MSVDVDITEQIKIDNKVKQEILEPSLYKVILLNDNQTPIEWVIDLLTTIFKHTQEAAEKLTLEIHNEGSGIAGIYYYEIAEQKSTEAILVSREHGFPLQIKLEKE